MRDRTRDKVRLIGGAIFRLKSTPQGISAQFVDPPDPLDPNTPTGFIAALTFDPPSFFFGGSEFGMTADKVLYDGSEDFTPPSIVERGHGSDWMGLSIKEATVYFPPSVGHLSIGVRNLLLGHPFGLQLEVRVEFGYLNLETFSVNFTKEGSTTHLPVSGTGQSRTVEIDSDSVQISGQAGSGFLPSGDARTPSGFWTLPEHDDATAETTTSQTGLETESFEVRPGDLVRFQARALDSGEIAAQFPELLYRFERASSGGGGSSSAQHAPQVNLTVNGHTFDNVVQLTGAASQMSAVEFAADVPASEGSGLQWNTAAGSSLTTGRTLAGSLLPTGTGQHVLILRDPASNKTRRVVIEVHENTGELLVGCADGVFNSQNTRVNIQSVHTLYDLGAFHASGARAALDAPRPTASSGTVTLAEGQLALTAVAFSETAPPIQPPPAVEMLAIGDDARMIFGQATFMAGEVAALEAFLSAYQSTPDVNIIIVGRTDDLWDANTDLDRRRSYNADLAVRRAAAARDEVVRILGSGSESRVFAAANRPPDGPALPRQPQCWTGSLRLNVTG